MSQDQESPKEVAAEKPEPVITAQPSSNTNWLVIGIVFIVLLIMAVVLGLRAEQQFGNKLYQTLPAKVTSQWVSPTPQPVVQPTIELTIEPSIEPTLQITIQPELTDAPEPLEPPSDEGAELTDYILPFSDAKKVTEVDLADLTPWELKVARNEIYARHGREFVHQDLACYFADQAWYSIDPDFSTASLSSLEVANATFILNYEKEISSPLLNKDSGCGQIDN